MFKDCAVNEDAMGRKFDLFKPDSDLVGIKVLDRTDLVFFTRRQLVDLLRYMDDPNVHYPGKKV